MENKQDSKTAATQQRKIVFVLGGPGSGKGTQCGKLVSDFDLVHLSAGELLRQHIASGSTEGKMVQDLINQGQIVPSYVTVGLLEKAMNESDKHQFLIDGFPRNSENHQAFLKTGMDCEFVLFFDCDEETMIQRLLSRNEGRTDDNIDTIRKRFKVFLEQTMEVLKHYEVLGRVRKVDAKNDPETVYSHVKDYFSSFVTRKEKQLVA
eukprot:g3579.t1